MEAAATSVHVNVHPRELPPLPGLRPTIHQNIVLKNVSDNEENQNNDSISVSSNDELEDRQEKVVLLAKVLQSIILKGCVSGETGMRWKLKVKQLLIKFVRMFLYNYHPDSYFFIRGVLLDCKSIVEDFNIEEEKAFIVKGLQLIKEKCLQEDIAFCGAGGFDV